MWLRGFSACTPLFYGVTWTHFLFPVEPLQPFLLVDWLLFLSLFDLLLRYVIMSSRPSSSSEEHVLERPGFLTECLGARFPCVSVINAFCGRADMKRSRIDALQRRIREALIENGEDINDAASTEEVFRAIDYFDGSDT